MKEEEKRRVQLTGTQDRIMHVYDGHGNTSLHRLFLNKKLSEDTVLPTIFSHQLSFHFILTDCYAFQGPLPWIMRVLGIFLTKKQLKMR